MSRCRGAAAARERPAGRLEAGSENISVLMTTSPQPAHRFSYRRTADGLLFINWDGRQVRVLRGIEATKVMYQLRGADPDEAQLLLARHTGNFKRGDER